MAFNPGSYTKHADYQLMVQRFKGVDSTDPAFSLDNARGTYSNNYAYIGDCVQTRWAKEQVADLGDCVRGLWHFRAEDGNTHYVAILGNEVAELSNLTANAVRTDLYALENGEGKCFAVVGNKRLWLLTGEKYLMVYHNGSSIVCEEVAESDYCYVPTTMTSIVATDAITQYTNAQGESESMSTRVELDKPNMLSRWRKNKILTGVPRSGTAMPNYVLDGVYAEKEDFDYLNVTVHLEADDFGSVSISEEGIPAFYDEDFKNELLAISGEDTAVYVTDGSTRINKFTARRFAFLSNAGLSYKSLFVEFVFDGVTAKVIPFDQFVAYAKSENMGMHLTTSETGFSISYSDANTIRFKTTEITVEANATLPKDFRGEKNDGDIVLKDGTTLLEGNEDRVYIVEKFFTFVGGLTAQTTDVGVAVTDKNGRMMLGYIENVEGSSVFTMFIDPKPAIGGQSNVTVTFPVYNEALSNEIDGCRIGCRFGHNNSLNRLWVSGNANLPHYVMHSEVPSDADRAVDGDYSYFPLDGELKFGNEENAVLGLDVIDTNRMIVLKGKAGNERTIYFVTPSSETKVLADGITSVSEESYQITMSNSPVSILGLGQVVNFYGATLFIGGDNKVNMLTESGAIGNTARQAVSVSHYIDYELSTQNLENAVLFSFDKYLILNAETRSYVSNHDSASNGQFEWWPCDKFQGATFFLADRDGTVFYGTEDGKLFKLTLDGDYREDTEFFFSEKPDEGEDNISSLSVPQYTEEGGIVSPKVKDSDLFQPNADNEPYISLGRIGEDLIIRPNMILFKEAPSYPLHDGVRVFLDNGEILTRILTECENPVEYNGETYWFAYSTENEGPAHGILGTDVLIKMEDEYEIKNRRFFYQGKRVDVRTIGGTKTRLYGSFKRKEAVIPEFVTKPLLCETLNYAKTITQAELWNDTRMPSELHAKMVGNKVWSLEADKSVQDSRSQFSFDAPNFEDCGFDKKVVPTHYSLRRFPKSQAFFTIMLKGNSKRVSVLSGLKITYQKRGMAKGRG